MSTNKFTISQQQRIAETILRQLGGNRIKTMIGMKNLTCGESNCCVSLGFRHMRGSKGKSNYCKITLNTADTYDMEFLFITRYHCDIVKVCENVYSDQLEGIFGLTTGLSTSL